MHRREFLSKLMAVSACAIPFRAYADNTPVMHVVRQETGERRSMIMLPEYTKLNYADLCVLGRDVQKNEMHPLRPVLLDRWWSIYSTLQRAIGFNGYFVLQSAYRSVDTNREVGGALSSWHLSGGALDFHAEGVNMSMLAQFVRVTHGGGVGYYKRSTESRGWMHMDEGRTRYWEG